MAKDSDNHIPLTAKLTKRDDKGEDVYVTHNFYPDDSVVESITINKQRTSR